MIRVEKGESKTPYITKDGSEIREIFKSERMSLAEATVRTETKLHVHKSSDELYYILEGKGDMEIEGEGKEVCESDTVVIPHEKKHRILTSSKKIRFLCVCAPPYSDDDTLVV
jgi:mannose-6-phosphate isomerase-like protein (cupin superfamily)